MKKILCINLFCLFTISVAISQSKSNLPQDSVTYVTATEVAFMIDRESKFLLKINPSKPTAPGSLARTQQLVNFEYKLSKSFSISSNFAFGRFSQKVQFSVPNLTWTGIVGGLEARYYLGMAKRIKSDKQANNLSGNYIATSVNYSESFGNILLKNSAWNYGISYGIQRRFLNFGYLDYVFVLNLRDNTSASTIYSPSRKYQSFSISSAMNAGIAFGKNYKLGEDATCPIFKCFKDRRMAFKINLNKTMHLGITDLKNPNGSSTLLWYLRLNPNIIFENKLGGSPFSLEQDLDLLISFIGSKNTFTSVSFQHVIKYRSSIKYYHLQKANIRNGKSGNNLSGVYIFGRGEYLEEDGNFRAEEDDLLSPIRTRRERNIALQVGYGYQKEVLNNLFFDLSLGATKKIMANFNRSLSGIGVVADIKVGLFF